MNEIPALYLYRDEMVVAEDQPFEMGGSTIVPVRARTPVFITEGRYPGRPTTHGWAKLEELTPLTLAEAQDMRAAELLENWRDAMHDADAIDTSDLPGYVVAGAWAAENEAAEQYFSHVQSIAA